MKNQNTLLTIKETEFIIKNLSTEKTLDPDGFTGEFF